MKKYCSFDIETTGLHPFTGVKIFAFCIGYMDGRVEVIRLDDKDKLKPGEGASRLKEFLADTSISKICHNLKFEYTVCKLNGYHIPENTEWHDTMIMSQLLQNNNPRHSLDYLAWQFGRYPMAPDDEIAAMGKEYKGWQNVPVNKMKQYQITDGERTTLLFLTFWPHIKDNPALLADYKEEIDLITNTFELENRGILLHEKETNRLEKWLHDEVNQIQNDLFKALGEYVNLNSSQQVAHILFKKLKLPIIALNEDTGNIKTSKDILFELKKTHPHPVIDLIMKQRSYVKGIGILNNYRRHAIDGVIHANIKTNFAITGRQASDSPNLQNVSKDDALKNPFPVPARKCFRPRPGFVFLMFDFSGIEMRLIVDDCGEEELLAICAEGGDLHKPAADIFFEDRFIKETDKAKKKVLRSASKNGQFGIAYGSDSETLALTLMMSVEDGLKAKKRYCERFPKVGNYCANLIDEIRLKGHVIGAFGRKLYINRDQAYVGANAKIQHNAAGILKRAQNNIFKNILNESSIYKDALHMILPVHDELIFELSRDLLSERDTICRMIAKEMTTIPGIRVRLDVEAKMSTTTWADAKEFSFYGK
jgi:DNA polymerase I